MIAEMLHTASLIHDDVIDSAETRRGKSSVHHKWGEKKVSERTHGLNLSNAEATFFQSTRTQRFLKTILTLSCW